MRGPAKLLYFLEPFLDLESQPQVALQDADYWSSAPRFVDWSSDFAIFPSSCFKLAHLTWRALTNHFLASR